MLALHAGENILIFICLSLGTFVHIALLLSCSIDFWTLFSPDRILSLTTSGSLQRLHRIKLIKQNVSLKPVSSFCARKNMIYVGDVFLSMLRGYRICQTGRVENSAKAAVRLKHSSQHKSEFSPNIGIVIKTTSHMTFFFPSLLCASCLLHN